MEHKQILAGLVVVRGARSKRPEVHQVDVAGQVVFMEWMKVNTKRQQRKFVARRRQKYWWVLKGKAQLVDQTRGKGSQGWNVLQRPKNLIKTLHYLASSVGCGSALVELMPFDRRVAVSKPALAVT